MHDRLIRSQTFDDGVNAWAMHHVAPVAPLASLIRGFSDYTERTGGFTTRRELPHGEGVLIVNLGDPIAIIGGDGAAITLGAGEAFVAGVHLRAALSRSSGAQRGVHVFLPLATLRRLLGVPMHELVDRVVPLDALLGPAAHQFGEALVEAATLEQRSALLEAALLARLANLTPLRAADRHALALVMHRPELDLMAVARTIGWSRKHLASRVQDTIGIGPRSFRRLLRFARVVEGAGVRDRGRAGLAYDCGYSDQSHMVREFREFAGVSPTAFRAQLLDHGGGLVEQ